MLNRERCDGCHGQHEKSVRARASTSSLESAPNRFAVLQQFHFSIDPPRWMRKLFAMPMNLLLFKVNPLDESWHTPRDPRVMRNNGLRASGPKLQRGYRSRHLSDTT